MSVVFALPGAVPAPPPSPFPVFEGLEMTWTGWDGVEWPLYLPDSGVMLLADGVEGLDVPPWEVYDQTSPGVHGSRARGYRVQPRPVFWPILLYSDASSREWMIRDRAWWKTMQPLKYGTWTVTHPGTNEQRYLHCRFDGSPKPFAMDPMKAGWAEYGVELVADEEPFWLGDPVSRTFATEPPEDFFNDGAAPVFRISSGSSLSTAKVTNPGDEAAWPIWTITGPTTSVKVGLGGLQVEVPFEIFEGQTVSIDTRPHRQIAMRGTEEVTHLLGAAEFVPVPAGRDVSLDLAVVGTGTVRCDITPRYLRAW
ncbi:hypothetical protein ACFYE2_00450 [Kocuria sp. CPCC 205300]|uniref:hypothetical protein n=1 Tax=Kocuria sabuli TaxID=3071448 RepID=UPI0036D854C7